MLGSLKQSASDSMSVSEGRAVGLRPAPGAILHTVHGKLAVSMLAGMLIAATSAFALNPTLDVSQYAHTAWKIRDGFAKGSIIAIAQTPDGYLWLGTAFGL